MHGSLGSRDENFTRSSSSLSLALFFAALKCIYARDFFLISTNETKDDGGIFLSLGSGLPNFYERSFNAGTMILYFRGGRSGKFVLESK